MRQKQQNAPLGRQAGASASNGSVSGLQEDCKGKAV
jgi:hypothetical protein